MKILLYCFAFSPSIGGIEIVTETLARNLTKLGHSCTVSTETLSQTPDDFPFPVVRRPDKRAILELMKQADVVCNIELSLKYFWLSRRAGKPLIWVHNGYKLVSIDALGWYKDEPAPMKPWQSILFYRKKEGLRFAFREGIKLYGRRWASARIFCNVAGSEWINKRQPLRNQVQIYTPFPVDDFTAIANRRDKKYDFVFLGRLVPEKGVETLLKAFKKLVTEKKDTSLKLAIIGYGAAENQFKNCASELQLNEQVFFLGPKRGKELTSIIRDSEIAVVPSRWEEPLGGVALQMLAAGRVMIVSKNGGLKEVVGEAGLTFTNGDADELFEMMKKTVDNEELKKKLLEKRQEQLDKFNPDKLTERFVELFKKAVAKKPIH